VLCAVGNLTVAPGTSAGAELGEPVREPSPLRCEQTIPACAYDWSVMAVEPALQGGRRATSGPAAGLGALAGRSRKRWPRRLLITANAVVLVLLALGASAYGYVQWRFGQVHRIAVAGLTPIGSGGQSVAADGSPMTILLVGSDTRDLGKGAISSYGNDAEVTGQRSDTMMLVRVVPATSSIALLSVPRDLLVPVAGYGTTRINAAFSGGPNLLVGTIQQDLGIQINHFAVVNFLTFTRISDSLGGVYQYFPTPARDIWSNLVVPQAGCVLLKGNQALAFVRSREYQYYLDGSWQYQLVPESDLARIQRQQDFIKLALKKAEEAAPTNPVALNEVISGITSSVTVDSHFSSSQLINLALDLRHTNVAGIPNWTYPTVNSTEVPGALDPVPAEDQLVVNDFLHYGMPKAGPASATSSSGSTSPVATSSITVQVLNGSGVSGQAREVARNLEADGFKVGSTGDAGNFNYTHSVVEYGPTGPAAAKVLEAKVGGGTTLQEVASLSGNHLVLITGPTSVGVSIATTPDPAGPTGASTPKLELISAVSAAPPVSPDSSSYYNGQYIPAGLQPGQVPKTCPS
jgi:LCP family protein required for cell wall assembly